MATQQPRGFGLNGKSYYTNVANPKEISLQFTVTPTNGLGVTSVKSNGYVRNVFMYTSTTPTSHNGYLNPNPAAGYVLIQMYNEFNYYISNLCSVRAPNSGSDVKIDNSALTVGQAYVITTVGDSTVAQWQAVGLPAGITPAVGVSFIATAVGAGANTSTSMVQVPSTSGIYMVEMVGNPGVMNTPSQVTTNGGAWLLAQFLKPSGTFTGSALAAHSHALLLKNAAVVDGTTTRVNAGTNLLGANTGSDITVAGGGANGGVQTASAGTPSGEIALAMAAAAPTTGSVISMQLMYDGSTVTIDGI